MVALGGRRPALLLRSVFLLLFLLFLVYATFFARWRPHGLDAVKDDLASFGPGAPVAAVVLQAIGVLLFIPGFLLILATAILFGLDSIWISLAGQTLGAVLAYLVARHVGRDLLHAVLGQRLLALERALERHAFRTLVLLRLMSLLPGPFIVYAPGLVRVPLRQVVGAAVLGQIPFVVVLAFLGHSLASVREPADLLTPSILFPMSLLGALIVFPLLGLTLLRRQRRRARAAADLPEPSSPEPAPPPAHGRL